METKTLNEETIVRYLLGDLPEEELAQVEDRAFSDREYLQNVLAVESDLIDEYVRGELSDPDRRQFERRFLVSEDRQRKVEFARALAKVNPEVATENVMQPTMVLAPTSWWNSLVASLSNLNPVFQFSMAAAALILVIGVSWLALATIRLRAQVDQLQAEQETRNRQEQALQQQVNGERARQEDLAAQLQREREHNEELARQLERDRSLEKPAGSSFIPSLFLPPGLSRGAADRPTLVASPAARQARLQIGLEPGDEYPGFRAELHTQDGREVWSRDNLRARTGSMGRYLVLNLPAALLSEGGYELALKGIVDQGKVEEVGYYYFNVVRK